MRPAGPRSARPLRWRAAAVALLAAAAACAAPAGASAAGLALAKPPVYVPSAPFGFPASGTADATKSEVVLAILPMGSACPSTMKESQGRSGFIFGGFVAVARGPFTTSVPLQSVSNIPLGEYQVCGYLYAWADYPLPGAIGPYDLGSAPAAAASTTWIVAADAAFPNDQDKDGILDAADACPKERGIASEKGCPPFSAPNYPMKVRRLQWRDFHGLIEGSQRTRLATSVFCSRPCKLHTTISFSAASAKALGVAKRKIRTQVGTRTRQPAGNFIEIVRFEFGFSRALRRKMKKLKTLEFVVTSYATEDGGDGRVNRRPLKYVFTGPKR